MKMSYLSCVVTLLSASPLVSLANSWDQSQNDLILSSKAGTNNNLFNSSADTVSANLAELGLQWHWRQLYEGYALALPLTVQRRHYNTSLLDDVTLYTAQPAVRFFLNDSTDLSLETEFNRRQILRGDDAAEFLTAEQPSLLANSRLAQLVLQIGRAPDLQNVQIRLGSSREERELGWQALGSQDADYAQLRYSHKINENIALVLDASRRQEQQAELATDVDQAGAGVVVAWTGNQQFSLVLGRFSRNYQESLADVSGNYWQMTNQWQLSRQWQLALSSSRQSVLSYATDSVSQLDTRHQLELQWQPFAQHQIAFSVSRLRTSLDQQQYQRTRDLMALRWQWQLSEHWRTRLFTERLLQQVKQQPEREGVQFSAEISWLW